MELVEVYWADREGCLVQCGGACWLYGGLRTATGRRDRQLC